MTTANEECEPSVKKPKLAAATDSTKNDDIQWTPLDLCTALLAARISLPVSMKNIEKCKNSVDKLQTIFDSHGFRTSLIFSPRPALSVYKDSCFANDGISLDPFLSGEAFILTMLGLHPNQLEMEEHFTNYVKPIYSLLLFCRYLGQVLGDTSCTKQIADMLEIYESSISSLDTLEAMHAYTLLVPEKTATLLEACIQTNPRIRTAQLQKELERLALWTSTLSNALITLFLDWNNCSIKDVFFKRSLSAPKYDRITIYLFDPDIDIVKPPQFIFMPSVTCMIQDGPHAVVNEMIDTFWDTLLRNGYFATTAIRHELTPNLKTFLLSGIAHDLSIPLKLKAHFDPKWPLSFYLCGKAGTGKSSLVRSFSPALNSAIEQHADPELLVRFVKQNLNKPFDDLSLEFELRPNNNDYSVMAIIQSRRMTMSQSKPGLVVVGLEEVASNDPGANPNQLQMCQLLSQRLSGRNGCYQEDKIAPRNSAKRGLTGDATLIVLFTSNYNLDGPCACALQRLDMFSNLKIIVMQAVAGHDRRTFAKAYMEQCIQDHLGGKHSQSEVNLELDIIMTEGDTRPLVSFLRMISFYVGSLLANEDRARLDVKVTQTTESLTVSVADSIMKLRIGAMGNIFPFKRQVFDKRAGEVVDLLKLSFDDRESIDWHELSQLIDFFFAKTLAPVVVVSHRKDFISALVNALGSRHNVRMIGEVDATFYKMMKCLYDPKDTPNLRDDILKFGRGAYAAIELHCPSNDAQLCIREIIEDTPSMTAFSTDASALQKAGLFFGVYVNGEISPEVRSRASFVFS
jgi:hypothetical protein